MKQEKKGYTVEGSGRKNVISETAEQREAWLSKLREQDRAPDATNQLIHKSHEDRE